MARLYKSVTLLACILLLASHVDAAPRAKRISFAPAGTIAATNVQDAIEEVATEAGAGTPGGADTQVQYNDGGSFGGEATFTYNDALNRLAVDGLALGASGTDYLMPAADGTAGYPLVTNGSGALSFSKTLSELVVQGQTDLEGYVAIGNGSALDSSYSLLIDRDFTDSGNKNVSQLMIGGLITKDTFAPGLAISYAHLAPTTYGPSSGITLDAVSPPVTATLYLEEPNITEVSGGAALIASTLYIKNAPTEGTSNYAIRVDAGNVLFDGDLNVVGTIEADTITEGGVAVHNNDEMDASSELVAIIDDETGSASGSPLIVFNQSPAIDGNIKNTPQHLRFNLPKPKDYYDNVDHEVLLWEQTDAAITITSIKCSCDADPSTELAFDLKWADAFIGFANAAVIDVIDTTSGTTDITSGMDDPTVPANKDIYLLLDATPDAAISQVSCCATYDYD